LRNFKSMDERHNITHISHQSDIDKSRKGQGGSRQLDYIQRQEKKRKEQIPFLDTAGERQMKTKSKREYKYIGRRKKAVDGKKKKNDGLPVEKM